MHRVHCHRLYMNELMIFSLMHGSTECGNIQQQYLLLIIACFHSNVDFVFLYQLLWWMFLNHLSWLYIVFDELSWKNSSLPTFHRSKNTKMRNMKWRFFYCGNKKLLCKTSIPFSCRTNHFFTRLFPLLLLYYIISHNSLMFLYLNGINPCIRHLYTFCNI